jgi:membrane-bound lytic murein transglycosylase D
MKLKIPKNSSSYASSSNKSPVDYKVKRGDSLWKISQIFNVSIRELMEWNNISNPRSLKRGDVIKIYPR